jgi:nitrile hydratase beta subunit
MNGVHDMGGMQDMGPLRYEKNEPVFHAPWEARIFAIWWADDTPGYRYQAEILPPDEYLRMSYYERMLTAQTELLIAHGVITREELQSGRATPGKPKDKRLTAAEVPAAIAKVHAYIRKLPVAPLFQVGQRVRALNLNPITHTRLPRYARGRTGTIEKDYGVSDSVQQALEKPKPQHLYSVRFAARELWGEQAAPQDSVYIDLWDDYLEPA